MNATELVRSTNPEQYMDADHFNDLCSTVYHAIIVVISKKGGTDKFASTAQIKATLDKMQFSYEIEEITAYCNHMIRKKQLRFYDAENGTRYYGITRDSFMKWSDEFLTLFTSI